MLKEALRARRIMLDDVITLCPPGAANARVIDVIAWAPGFGKIKAERTLRRLRIPVGRTLRNLHPRGRAELVADLAKHHPKALYGAARDRYIC